VGDSVVAVMGNVYVNSKVRHIVAVMGNIHLGPQAVVEDNVVVLGGDLTKEPGAVVNGRVNHIISGIGGSLRWTRPWVQDCLLYGRPLAIAPGLAWLWWLALAGLMLYALVGLLFRAGLERCVETFEQHPGESVLTSIAALLLVPMVAALLLVTVIGIAAIPFLVLGLLAMIFFGKAAIFAWLGRRLTGFLGENRSQGNTLLAILVGGAIALALYCVPVVGFIVYNLIGLLGLGVALYALLAASRRLRPAPPRFATVPPTFTAPQPTPPPHSPAQPTGPAAGGIGTGAAPPAGAVPTPPAGGSRPGFSSAELLAMPRADFWPRMGALLIDTVLVGMLISMTLKYRPFGLDLIVLAGYGAAMWKVKGATVGGIICNHRVVRLDGHEIDWPTAVVRAMGCFLSVATAGLGFIWIAVDDHRQAWHDRIAGTIVVRVPPGTSQLL
jgi:uncharacterized RDD family membrane protein YckC